MPISPTNISKNSATLSNLDKTGRNFFLLLQTGLYLLQEGAGRIILTDTTASIGNLSKNSITPTNLAKS